MWTDLRHAIRSLALNRSATGLAIVCLALGIGVVTMVFAVVNGLLFQPMPIRDPGTLLSITTESRRADSESAAISRREFDDWQRLQLPAALAALHPVSLEASLDGRLDRSAALAATWNVLSVLGIDVIAGRALREDEDSASADGALLISETRWVRDFGSDHAALGNRVVINGRSAVIVGIVPRLDHPALPAAWRNAEFWVPLHWIDAAPPAEALSVIARPSAGRDLTAASRELQGRLEAATTAGPGDRTVRVEPVDLSLSPTTRSMLLTAMGAAVFVLLIGCGNVATLMLLRSTARQQEVATRFALGASRGRVVRQLLIESALVGLASIPSGLVLALAGRHWLLGAEAIAAVSIDWRVVAVTSGVALATSVLFGLAPVLQSLRATPRDLLSDGGRHVTAGRTPHRLRTAFATSQIALSLMLLVGTTLLSRSFANLLDADRDLDLARLVVVGLGGLDDRQRSAAEIAGVAETVESRVRTLPGVASTALAEFMPLRRGGPRVQVRVSDQDPAAPARTALRSGVSADFFTAMGIALEAGRPFSPGEARAGERVAVLNRRAADLWWPRQDAIGRRIQLDGARGDIFTVIGVSPDISNWDISGRPQPTVYVPLTDIGNARRVLIVRPVDDPGALMAPLRDIAASAGLPRQTVNPQLLETVSRNAFSRQRTLAVLFSVFSTMSLVLTTIGVYGVLSCFVSQRRRELGIRAALGAGRRDLIWLVGRQTLLTAASGVAIGLLVAAAITRMLQNLLFEVSTTDPLSFNVAATFLLAISLMASWIPARRAAAVPPATALRE
jgi:predicted permease